MAIDNKLIFKLNGESFLSQTLGFSSLSVIVALGISLLIKFHIIGLILGFSLILLSLFLFSKMINKVCMFDDFIEVNYFGLRKSKQITYSQIKYVYLNQEGYIPTQVYVAKILNKTKTEKITFFCSKNYFIDVSKHLTNKKVKIIQEK